MSARECIVGDCIEVMRGMAEASVDAIVTDPPYGLGFMGKAWDGLPPGPEFASEALRVLKPGGHLLAFGGTRTFHRLVVALEDAGFEIRDTIAWLYGSGFPKSLDVSKAIDKAGGDALAWREFSAAYAEAVSASHLTHADIDRELGVKSSSCYWARTDHRGGMPPRHHWERVCALLDLPSAFARLYDAAEREKVGEGKSGISTAFDHKGGTWAQSGASEVYDITAPATPDAVTWNGWGTALKPAHEPIVVARKPLVGTVATNVLEHGTGALNVDGCRVGDEVLPEMLAGQSRLGTFERHEMVTPERTGRWPANVVLDEEAAELLDEQSGESTSRIGKPRGSQEPGDGWGMTATGAEYADKGGASRFFYCAKASRKERNAGLDGFKVGASGPERANTDLPLVTRPQANTHPTVKPVALMRWLVRLVTPPNGLVLDPFLGSGTTGVAAALEGFNFVGIEREAEYADIARARIAHAYWDNT